MSSTLSSYPHSTPTSLPTNYQPPNISQSPPTIYTLNTCCLPSFHIPRSKSPFNFKRTRHTSMALPINKKSSHRKATLSFSFDKMKDSFISKNSDYSLTSSNYYFHIIRRIHLNDQGQVHVQQGKIYLYLRDNICQVRGLVVPREPSIYSHIQEFSPLYEHLTNRSSLHSGVYEIIPATPLSISLSTSIPSDVNDVNMGDLLYIPTTSTSMSSSSLINSTCPQRGSTCSCKVMENKRTMHQELLTKIPITPAVVIC